MKACPQKWYNFYSVEETVLRKACSCYFQSFNSAQQAFFTLGNMYVCMYAFLFMNCSKHPAVKSQLQILHFLWFQADLGLTSLSIENSYLRLKIDSSVLKLQCKPITEIFKNSVLFGVVPLELSVQREWKKNKTTFKQQQVGIH